MNNLKSMFKPISACLMGAIICSLVFCSQAHGQSALKKAPEIIFSNCLNYPGTSSAFFKNKYVVLDFWATWCGPCIAAFPHLDSLSQKFSSDSVVFAIISSEDKIKVSKFLKKIKVKAYHLIDSVSAVSKAKARINDLYGITAQNFKVGGIPHTVVFDKNNNIVFTSEGTGPLTEATLDSIVHNKGRQIMETIDVMKANQLLRKEEQAKTFALIKKDTLYENDCRLITASLPYTEENMTAGYSDNKQVQFVEIEGRPIEFSYFYFTRLPFNRIINKTRLGSVYTNFEGPIDMQRKEFWTTALKLLSKAHHINFVKENREVDSYELEITDLALFNLKTKPLQDDSSNHVSNADNNNELIFSNFTLDKIANNLEDYLEIPVLVEDEKYKDVLCDMTIKKGNVTQINNYLTLNYGVRLKAGKHRVEFTNIVPSN